jgi:D-alanine-D-alanine ligase
MKPEVESSEKERERDKDKERPKAHTKPLSTEAAARSLGPVPNFEAHVKSDWWRVIFNSLYLKTDADVVDDRGITSGEIDLFVNSLGLKPDERVLDLCCGQGRHALELARRGFQNVEGLDRSRYLVQKAKSRAKKERLAVKIREGDAKKLPYAADTFDAVIIAGNSFGYFETMQEDLAVLNEVFRVLKPWGRLLVDVANGDWLRENYQPRSWEWMDKSQFVCRERSLSMDKQRLISREIINHVERGVLADQFYAVRLYNAESIKDILAKARFSDISFHGAITTSSQRNQDLGMMAERVVVTAKVRKDWAQVRKKGEAIKEVVVVMGDPSKPDPLKPFFVFDEDDFYTIDRLKDALRELGGFKFSYMNHHDTIVQELMNLRQKDKVDFVFNLCDEGYLNNARHELHVPAMLEVLGIQYTGAGPQCLGFCYDKSLTRGVAKEMGIPVPEAFFIKPEDSTFDLSLSFPVIVKPNLGDSSFGITQKSVASSLDDLISAIWGIRDKLGYDRPLLVEEFLTGKDLTVGIIGNPPESYTVLPIIEEDYSMLPEGLPRICGYEAKWLPDSPYWKIKSVRAELQPDTEKALVEWCLKLFERLECRDYARFDWRLDSKGMPRLLEVNPNPGWCWDGHLAKMAGMAGMSYGDMLKAIIEAADNRIALKKKV